jgi:hypothetical protein
LKLFVSGKHFVSDEEVERAVDGDFHSLPDSHFQERIRMLERCRTKCFVVKGDYREK